MDKTVKCPCGNIVKKGPPKMIAVAKVCDCDCHFNDKVMECKACLKDHAQCEKCKRFLLW